MGNSSPKRARARAEQGVGLLVDELDGGNLRGHVVVGRRAVTVSRNVSSRRARKHQQQADLLRHAVEAPAHVGRTHALAQLDLPARQVGVDEHVGIRGHERRARAVHHREAGRVRETGVGLDEACGLEEVLEVVVAHGPKLAVVGDRVANAGLGGPHVLCAVVGKQGELGTERADKPTAKLVVVDARVALDGKNRCGGTRGRPARACLTSPATALHPRTAMPASRTSMVGHWSKDTPRVASSPPIGMRFLLTHRGTFAGLPQTATIASLPGPKRHRPSPGSGASPIIHRNRILVLHLFVITMATAPDPRVRTGGTMTHRTADGPLCALVTRGLRAKNANGTWEPGERIPSVLALCDACHVSPITVRRGIDTLAREAAGTASSRGNVRARDAPG